MMLSCVSVVMQRVLLIQPFVAVYRGLVGMAEVAPTMFDGTLSMERWMVDG